MVIFRITKEMSKREYLLYSKRIVQQYEWGKNNDNCLVVPEYVEVYVVNNKQACVEDQGADLNWLWGKENKRNNYDKVTPGPIYVPFSKLKEYMADDKEKENERMDNR